MATDNESNDFEQEQQEVADYLKKSGVFTTMPEILAACTGFVDAKSLASVLSKMVTSDKIVRRMGDKIGKNNNTLNEYTLPELAQGEKKSLKEIISNSSHDKKRPDTGLRVFDSAIASLKKKLAPIKIEDYDTKIKVLAQLSHILDEPLSSVLKDISKDLEVVNKANH